MNEQGDEEVEYIVEDDEDDPGNNGDAETRTPRGLASTRALEAWRDGIATHLWDDYMRELASRGVAHDMQPHGPAVRPPRNVNA